LRARQTGRCLRQIEVFNALCPRNPSGTRAAHEGRRGVRRSTAPTRSNGRTCWHIEECFSGWNAASQRLQEPATPGGLGGLGAQPVGRRASALDRKKDTARQGGLRSVRRPLSRHYRIGVPENSEFRIGLCQTAYYLGYECLMLCKSSAF